MLPVAFRLGAFAVYTYPLVLFAAWLAAALLARSLAPRVGIRPAAVTDLALAVALGGLVGARVWFVLSNLGLYAGAWWRVFELQNGGLVFYGAVGGGTAAAVVYARSACLPLPAVADLAALAVPLGAGIGRFGCLAAGCCGGPGLALGGMVVPPQVVDAAAEFALLGVLFALSRRTGLGRGMLAWWWLALYPCLRFGIEYLRADARVGFGLTQAQLVSAVLVVVAVSALVRTRGGER